MAVPNMEQAVQMGLQEAARDIGKKKPKKSRKSWAEIISPDGAIRDGRRKGLHTRTLTLPKKGK